MTDYCQVLLLFVLYDFFCMGVQHSAFALSGVDVRKEFAKGQVRVIGAWDMGKGFR